MREIKCRQCGEHMKADDRPYHYTESGLDNVYLVGIQRFICKNGHETVRIPKMAELHALITEHLLRNPSLLVGKEVRFLRKQMGMLGKELAEQLSVTPIQVSRWENGKSNIPVSRDRLFRLTFLRRLEERRGEILIPHYLDILDRLSTPPVKRPEIRVARQKSERKRSPFAAALAV